MPECEENREASARPLLLPLRHGIVAALVGVLAFALSCAVATPQTGVWGLGAGYAAMAAQPWAFVGPTPHRVLGPVLAWSLGLDGDRYAWFSHGTMVVFLAVVHGGAMHRGARWWQACALAAALALTRAVGLYKGVVGYPDAASFTLLLLAALSRSAGWFWTWAALGLLNHEITLLFWPWLLHARGTRERLSRRDGIGAALALGVFAAVHTLAHEASDGGGAWSIGFFLAELRTTSRDVLGMWLLTVLGAVMALGALLALLGHPLGRDGRRGGASLALFAAGLLTTSLFAVDLWRFVCFLVVPVALAGADFVRRPFGVVWLAGLVAASFALDAMLAPRFAAVVDGMFAHYPEQVAAILPHVLPAQWPTFVVHGVTVVALLLLGHRLGRRDTRRT